MNVEMPDGTIIEGVPEGTSKAEILAKWERNRGGKSLAEETGPVEAAMVQAGRATSDLLRGAKRLYLQGVSAIPGAALITDPAKEILARMETADAGDEAYNKAATGKLREAHPVASMAGEVLAALPFGVAGKGYQAAMAAGALPGLISDGSGGERLASGALGAAGGAAGQALGNLVGRLVSRRGAEALSTPERDELVRVAQAMGYELTPAQISGKQWQKNLDAVLRQNPATSERMGQMIGANQATTERIVGDALERAGGYIDQPSAAASATGGITKGLEKEAGVIDRAYRNLLAGRDVNLEATRPALEAILASQRKLPEANQGGEAVKALQELLGTPGYAKKAKAFVKPSVDEYADDIVTAVRKLGGINPADEAVGSLAKANPFPNDPRLGPVWRNRAGGSNTTSGHSLDTMAQLLEQYGYPVRSPDDLMEAIANHGLGNPTYSVARDIGAAKVGQDPLAVAIEGLNKRLDAKMEPPAPKAGYLRENKTIPGEMAQDLRSDYGIKSEAAYANAKNQAGDTWREMKGVVDDAIEAAVPKSDKEQFASINRRYGLGDAVKNLAKRDQQTLLNQIYRGFNSEDEFAHFVAMAPDKEFREVARGFLSKIKDEARDKGGRVSAERLGRITRGANPDAMRMLGQESGETLSTVGQIGEQLLPDIPNSGTAQRLLLQSLISGGGLLSGGMAGGEYGTPGAIIGAGLGAFAAPKLAQKIYLSDLARGVLTRGAKEYSGVPMLRDMSPATRAILLQILRGTGTGVGLSATAE